MILLIEEKGQEVEFDLKGITHSEYYYASNDYSHITRLVANLLKQFTKEHIFLTENLKRFLKV